jgi:ADP-dependent phosphofructokinase/glucokinase
MTWQQEYEQLAADVAAAAPAARPLLAGFNTCVDHLHHLTTERLDALDDLARSGPEGPAGALTAEVMHRIGAGGDGEVFVPAPELAPLLGRLLGPPACTQVGGTGTQAAWALAMLGAPAVIALADRSREQLAVVHEAIGLAAPGGVVPAKGVAPAGTPPKPPHLILEYTAGTPWRGGVVPRSSRIIVRLAADGVERDTAFAGLPVGDVGAGLVSGLNGIDDGDEESRRWLTGVVRGWRDGGLPLIHLELAEYPTPELLAAAARGYGGLAHSLGLSLAELDILHGGPDPATAARDLARRWGYDRVVVHADTWSLAVHRGMPSGTALRTGNLLAAARARHGAPAAGLSPDPAAVYSDDLPPGGRLGDGWWADVAPAPYLARPAATIGLGDTFVAGLLLASCLDGARPSPMETEITA